jgi:hypothetical protein
MKNFNNTPFSADLMSVCINTAQVMQFPSSAYAQEYPCVFKKKCCEKFRKKGKKRCKSCPDR